jgi:hypothetical protein
MKFVIDIDEKSSKGKLTLDLIKELGFNAKKISNEINYGLPSSRKISTEELNNLLDEDELSENLILKEELEKYKVKKNAD